MLFTRDGPKHGSASANEAGCGFRFVRVEAGVERYTVNVPSESTKTSVTADPERDRPSDLVRKVPSM